MARDWETWLRNSIGTASATEEQDRDRTEKRIRDAINRDLLLHSGTRVFAEGSYANNTNVRRDSDVDIAVEWKAWSKISKINEATNYSWSDLGAATATHEMTAGDYRRYVEEFNSASVDTTGDKAIRVVGGSATLDADVVPRFRHLRYDAPGRRPHQGIQLFARSGGHINNWPEQNKANGNRKNSDTDRRYKRPAVLALGGDIGLMAAAVAATDLYASILRIHPYEDGKGRVAFVALQAALLSQGIYAVWFDDVDRHDEALGRALRTDIEPDAGPFARLIIERAIAAALDDEKGT